MNHHQTMYRIKIKLKVYMNKHQTESIQHQDHTENKETSKRKFKVYRQFVVTLV